MVLLVVTSLSWFAAKGFHLPGQVLHVHFLHDTVVLVQPRALIWGVTGDSFEVLHREDLSFRVHSAVSFRDKIILTSTRGVVRINPRDGHVDSVVSGSADTLFPALGSVWIQQGALLMDVEGRRRLHMGQPPRFLWGKPCGLGWLEGHAFVWTLDGETIHTLRVQPSSQVAWDCTGDSLLFVWGDTLSAQILVQSSRGDTLVLDRAGGTLRWGRFTERVPVVFFKDTLLWKIWIGGREVPWPADLLWFRPYAPGVWWGMELYPLQIVLFRPDPMIPEIQAQDLHLYAPFGRLYAPLEVLAWEADTDGDPDFAVLLRSTARIPDSLKGHGLLFLRNMSQEILAWRDSVEATLSDAPWPRSRVQEALRNTEVALYFGQMLWPERWRTWWDRRSHLLRVVKVYRSLDTLQKRAVGWLIAFAAGLLLMFWVTHEERLKPPPPAEAIERLLGVKFFHDIKYLLPEYTLDAGTVQHLDAVSREMIETLHLVSGGFRVASWPWRWWRIQTLWRLYAFLFWLHHPEVHRWMAPARMYRFLLDSRKTWRDLLAQPGVMEDLTDILQEVSTRLQGLFPDVDMVLRIGAAFETSCMFFTSDIRMLRRLLMALMENAVEAGATTLTVEAAVTEEGLELTLTDNGEGLPPELRSLPSRDRVVQIFTSGYSSRKGQGHHQGRGLSEDMLAWIEQQGEIWIEPRENGEQGTQVVLLFRRCRKRTEPGGFHG